MSYRKVVCLLNYPGKKALTNMRYDPASRRLVNTSCVCPPSPPPATLTCNLDAMYSNTNVNIILDSGGSGLTVPLIISGEDSTFDCPGGEGLGCNLDAMYSNTNVSIILDSYQSNSTIQLIISGENSTFQCS